MAGTTAEMVWSLASPAARVPCAGAAGVKVQPAPAWEMSSVEADLDGLRALVGDVELTLNFWPGMTVCELGPPPGSP